MDSRLLNRSVAKDELATLERRAKSEAAHDLWKNKQKDVRRIAARIRRLAKERGWKAKPYESGGWTFPGDGNGFYIPMSDDEALKYLSPEQPTAHVDENDGGAE